MDEDVPERDADEQPTGPSVTDAPEEDPGPDKPEEEPAARDGSVASLDEKRAGRSVAERVKQGEFDDSASAETEEEDDGQVHFVWERGKKVTLNQLIKRGSVAVEHAFVFGGKRVKGGSSLMDWDDAAILVSRGMPGKVSIVPTRGGGDDGEGITKVVVETHVPLAVVYAADTEAAVDLVRPMFRKAGFKVLRMTEKELEEERGKTAAS